MCSLEQESGLLLPVGIEIQYIYILSICLVVDINILCVRQSLSRFGGIEESPDMASINVGAR